MSKSYIDFVKNEGETQHCRYQRKRIRPALGGLKNQVNHLYCSCCGITCACTSRVRHWQFICEDQSMHGKDQRDPDPQTDPGNKWRLGGQTFGVLVNSVLLKTFARECHTYLKEYFGAKSILLDGSECQAQITR